MYEIKWIDKWLNKQNKPLIMPKTKCDQINQSINNWINYTNKLQK